MATRDENLEPTAASLSSAEFVDGEKDERFALHLSEDLEPVALKDWTAKDFANIYVRFRPHLERHAKKYLSNPSQVDEVVQDAFLYLMTSLPELDSELGVLRFLKWKTKMLALDVIRAGARAPIQVDSEVLERSAGVDNRDLNEVFERADDAAIVNLAFSKLSTRHREALVAAVYEEKSYEQAAQEMGLSENAFRQLLFRARSAFKKSLVGEAETAGLSVSQILSIAARKAASGSGKYIGSVGVLLLVLALTIPGQFGGSSNVPQEVAGPISAPAQPPVAPEAPAAEAPSSGEADPLAPSAVESQPAEQPEPNAPLEVTTVVVSETQEAAQEFIQAPAADESPAASIDLAAMFEPALRTSAEVAGFYLGNQRASSFDFYQDQNIEVFGGQGLSVFAHLDSPSRIFDSAVVELVSGETRLYGIPRDVSVSFSNSGAESTMIATLQNFIPVDSDEQVLGDEIFVGKIAQVTLKFNSDFSVKSASLFVISIN
jgi:RNA polymerase sigma factor (sigma-70 family)